MLCHSHQSCPDSATVGVAAAAAAAVVAAAVGGVAVVRVVLEKSYVPSRSVLHDLYLGKHRERERERKTMGETKTKKLHYVLSV